MTSKTSPFSYYPRLKRVKEYVEENLDQPITLKDAAEVVALEPKYFSKFFKKKVGRTFTNWLHSRRINAAKQLLRQENCSVTQVAVDVGFQSIRTFQRVFKNLVGVSPSDYRRRKQEREVQSDD